MSDNKKLVLLMLGAIVLVIFSFWIISPLGEDLGLLAPALTGGEETSVTAEGPDFDIDLDKDYKAVVKTTEGNFTIELLENNAPYTVNNFVYLSDIGFYNNSQFHRIVPGFVVQAGLNEGGDEPDYSLPDEINADSLGLDAVTVGEASWIDAVYDESRPSTDPFHPDVLAEHESEDVKSFYANELGYRYRTDIDSVRANQWGVGMANEGPNTASSQFFVITANSAQRHLDGRYTIFGGVTSGFSVLSRIESLGENQVKITDIEIVIE